MMNNSDIGRARPRSLVAPAASLAGALAAALVPQTVDAALVTVGGDGGVGTLVIPEGRENGTDVGGLVEDPLYMSNQGGPLGLVRRLFGPLGTRAFRSSGSYSGGDLLSVWEYQGALRNSSDNWIPVQLVRRIPRSEFFTRQEFSIWGWMQIQLQDGMNPTILSFTYDDEARDRTRFAKPIGGFSLTEPETDPVPEPGTLGLLGLGLGAAFVSRMRRGKGAQ